MRTVLKNKRGGIKMQDKYTKAINMVKNSKDKIAVLFQTGDEFSPETIHVYWNKEPQKVDFANYIIDASSEYLQHLSIPQVQALANLIQIEVPLLVDWIRQLKAQGFQIIAIDEKAQQFLNKLNN